MYVCMCMDDIAVTTHLESAQLLYHCSSAGRLAHLRHLQLLIRVVMCVCVYVCMYV